MLKARHSNVDRSSTDSARLGLASGAGGSIDLRRTLEPGDGTWKPLVDVVHSTVQSPRVGPPHHKQPGLRSAQLPGVGTKPEGLSECLGRRDRARDSDLAGLAGRSARIVRSDLRITGVSRSDRISGAPSPVHFAEHRRADALRKRSTRPAAVGHTRWCQLDRPYIRLRGRITRGTDRSQIPRRIRRLIGIGVSVWTLVKVLILEQKTIGEFHPENGGSGSVTNKRGSLSETPFLIKISIEE